MVIPMQKMKMLTVTLTMEAVLTKRKKLKNKGETWFKQEEIQFACVHMSGKMPKVGGNQGHVQRINNEESPQKYICLALGQTTKCRSIHEHYFKECDLNYAPNYVHEHLQSIM